MPQPNRNKPPIDWQSKIAESLVGAAFAGVLASLPNIWQGVWLLDWWQIISFAIVGAIVALVYGHVRTVRRERLNPFGSQGELEFRHHAKKLENWKADQVKVDVVSNLAIDIKEIFLAYGANSYLVYFLCFEFTVTNQVAANNSLIRGEALMRDGEYILPATNYAYAVLPKKDWSCGFLCQPTLDPFVQGEPTRHFISFRWERDEAPDREWMMQHLASFGGLEYEIELVDSYSRTWRKKGVLPSKMRIIQAA